MQHGLFELAIAIPRDGRSQKIREYGHQGLTYVEGRVGQAFSVIFKNNSPNQVLAIISIDGLGIVDGQPATAASRGYVVAGYSSCELQGWRTSMDEIRRFVFEGKAGSYATTKIGDASNCGIVACKVIAEKPKPEIIVREVIRHVERPWYTPVPYPVYPGPQPYWCYTSTSSTVPRGTEELSLDDAVQTRGINMVQHVAEFKLGTGWGAAQTDRVSAASFSRGAELATLSLYYTDAESLEKLGISLCKDVCISALPQGFGGFCTAPAVR